MLGFRPGTSGSGCRIHTLDVSTLRPEDIGPPNLTSWSVGVSPRDLERLSDQQGFPS
jgi:hypothetical protein